MTDATTAAARALIDRSQYLTLATADGDGRPWVSPVWFADEDYTEVLWVSRPDARHPLNIEACPAVALVVFDSTVAPQDAQAVYVEAKAGQVGAEVLDRALGDLYVSGSGTLVRAMLATCLVDSCICSTTWRNV